MRSTTGYLLAVSLTIAVFWAPPAAAMIVPTEPAATFGAGGVPQGVAYSGDGSMLAILTNIGIWLYDARSLEVVGRLDEPASRAVFSADGSMIATHAGRSIRVWDVATQTLVSEPGAPDLHYEAIAFLPSGKTLLTAGSNRIQIWDAATGERRRSRRTDEYVRAVCVNPTGKEVAVAAEREIQIRSLQNLKVISTIPTGRAPGSLAYSPDGLMLAGGDWEAVRIWDAATGTRIATLDTERGGPRAMAFTADSEALTTVTYGEIRRWRVEDGALEETIPSPMQVQEAAFRGNGQRMVRITGAGSGVQVAGVRAHSPVQALTDFGASANSIAFGQDGLLAIYRGYSIDLWDANTGSLRTSIGGAYGGTAVFPGNASRLATPSRDGLRFWDVDSWEQVGETARGWRSSSIVFTSDGSPLATVNRDHTIRFQDPATGDLEHVLQAGRIAAAALSPDDRWLVSSGMDPDPYLRIWDVRTKELVARIERPLVFDACLAFSPDGSNLAEGFYNWSGDNGVRLWDMATRQVVTTFEENSGGVTSVEFSLDGTLLAAGAYNGEVSLWDGVDARPLARLLGGEPAVREVAFSRNSRWLAVSTSAGPVTLWDLAQTGPVIAVDSRDRKLTTLGRIKQTALLANYPNPFNPETWIPFQLAHDGPVTIRIHSQRGALVRELDLGHRAAGSYTRASDAARWDGRDARGEQMPSGLYFYQLVTPRYQGLRRMVLRK